MLYISIIDQLKNYYKIKCLTHKISNRNMFGVLLYNFNNVCAYSNGNNKYISNELNYYNKNCTGLKWQCVEYARRYLQTVYEITFSDVDSAYQIPSAVFTRLKDNTPVTTTIYTDKCLPTQIESINNCLIVWAKDYEYDTPHGHVAVIVDVNTHGINVAEQNYNNNNYYRYISWDNIKNVSIISLLQ